MTKKKKNRTTANDGENMFQTLSILAVGSSNRFEHFGKQSGIIY